uniref:DUF155 domain-containing protein n=1 Tax=Aegilops tauschii TaxID=37682 RepID=M8BM36_AEGTA
MGRLRACRHHLRRLLETRLPPASPTPARLPHLPARASPFSSAVAVAATAPHDARDSGLGSSAYWAWIRAAAVAAPAPAPPQEEEEEGLSRYIPVKAYFLSTSIDLKSLQAEHGSDVVPPSTRSLNYIALRYSEFPPEIMSIGVKDNRFCYRYVVVFQYGSAVLFNIADHEAEHYLDMIRNHASGWLPEMRKDGAPGLTEEQRKYGTYRLIRFYNTEPVLYSHMMTFISQLPDYAVVEKPFLTTWMKGVFLVKVSLLIITYGRSEIAWKNANYAQILEYLREEYELNQRFGSLDFKLKFVEHNVHFLQEVLQNRRSNFLEWGVIILLAIEIVISLYEIIKDSSMMS